jgi:hypothetical protein
MTEESFNLTLTIHYDWLYQMFHSLITIFLAFYL